MCSGDGTMRDEGTNWGLERRLMWLSGTNPSRRCKACSCRRPRIRCSCRTRRHRAWAGCAHRRTLFSSDAHTWGRWCPLSSLGQLEWSKRITSIPCRPEPTVGVAHYRRRRNTAQGMQGKRRSPELGIRRGYALRLWHCPGMAGYFGGTCRRAPGARFAQETARPPFSFYPASDRSSGS